MSREREAYRDNLERLDKRFPDAEMLTIKEVAAFTGYSEPSVRKIFVFTPYRRISKADLARQMSARRAV